MTMSSFAALHPYLRAQLSEGRLAHAYVFTGSGGDEQALSLAAALCCLHPDEDGSACGTCQACNNIANGVYPDVRVFDPEGASHRVERMRKLVEQASLTPIAGSRKCFIIRQADNMSDEGANTLLKLLEEPEKDTVLILLTSAPDALLPTILSRCQLFSFGGSEDEFDHVLSDELEEKAVAFLRSLPQMPLYKVLLTARDYDKDRDRQRMFFFALLKALHRACRGELQLPMDGSRLLRSANMCESAVAMLGTSSIGNVAGPVARNVNQKMLTDVVYLRLWQNTTR